jgi:hypothetical protein
MTIETFATVISPFAATLVVSGPLEPDRREYPHFLFALNESETDGSVAFRDGSTHDIPHQTGVLFFVQGDGTHQVILGSPFSLP